MCLSAAKKPSIAAIMIFILRKMFFFYRSDRIKRRKKLYWKEISQITIWIEFTSFFRTAGERGEKKNQGKEGFIIIKAFKMVTR